MKGGCERAAHWSAFVHGLVALPSSFLWWLEKESSLGQKKENSSFFLSLHFSWLYHPWKGSDIYMFLAVGLSLVQILWANKYFSQRPWFCLFDGIYHIAPLLALFMPASLWEAMTFIPCCYPQGLVRWYSVGVWKCIKKQVE